MLLNKLLYSFSHAWKKKKKNGYCVVSPTGFLYTGCKIYNYLCRVDGRLCEYIKNVCSGDLSRGRTSVECTYLVSSKWYYWHPSPTLAPDFTRTLLTTPSSTRRSSPSRSYETHYRFLGTPRLFVRWILVVKDLIQRFCLDDLMSRKIGVCLISVLLCNGWT